MVYRSYPGNMSWTMQVMRLPPSSMSQIIPGRDRGSLSVLKYLHHEEGIDYMSEVKALVYGGAYVISNQDPGWTQKPIYTSILHTILGPDYYVVVVLTLAHRYNAVRGHRTGSNNSGAEIISGGKQIKTEDHTHNN